MVHVVCATYHCSDEYVLDKPILWLQNRYEVCLRDRHDERVLLATAVFQAYASGMSNEVEPLTMWDDRPDREEIEEPYVPPVKELQGIGLGVRLLPKKVEDEKKKE